MFLNSSPDDFIIDVTNGKDEATPLLGSIQASSQDYISIPMPDVGAGPSSGADVAQEEFSKKTILRIMRFFVCGSGLTGLAVGAYAQRILIEDAQNLFGVNIAPSPALTLGLGALPTVAYSAFNDSSFEYWRDELYKAFKDTKTATRIRQVEFIAFTILSILLSVPQYFFTLNGISNSRDEEIYKLFKILQIPIGVLTGYGSVFGDFFGMYKTYRHFVHGDSLDGTDAKFNIYSILPLAMSFIIAVFIYLLLGELSLPSSQTSIQDKNIICPIPPNNVPIALYDVFTWVSFIPEVLTMTIIIYEIYHKTSLNNIVGFVKSPSKICGTAFTIVGGLLQGYALRRAVKVVAACTLPGIGATGATVATSAAYIIGVPAFAMLWAGSMSGWFKNGGNTIKNGGTTIKNSCNTLWEAAKTQARRCAPTNNGEGAQAGDASTRV